MSKATWRATPTMPGRRTMGLLMSDTTLIDAMLDETLHLLDDLHGLAYADDRTRDSHEDDGAELPG